jgi:hypothetical protein
LKQRIEDGATNATLALEFDSSKDSIRRFRIRHKTNPRAVENEYTTVSGDTAEGAVVSPGKILDDPDELLIKRGLNPEDWEISYLTVNDYQGPASAERTKQTGETSITYYQTKFTATRVKSSIQLVAARDDGRVFKPKARSKRLSNKPRLVVVVGDQQAPFQDPGLHQSFIEWLDFYQPDEGVSLGDTADYPDISRHRLDPENTATVNECTQSTYDMLLDYRLASEDTDWTIIGGNHCSERLRNILLDKPSIRPVYGIKRADTAEEAGAEVITVEHLWRLDELGFKYIDPHGKYDLAEHKLSDHLGVRHGWIARKDSGSTALETLKALGYSILVGHGHRQAQVFKTVHDIDRTAKTLTGVEIGCMCRVTQEIGPDGRVWPNYTVAPDWQQGFASVTIWPDGMFKVDLATYVNGTLLYRDTRF